MVRIIFSGGAERVSKSAPSANECCSRCRYYLPFITNDHHHHGGDDNDDDDDGDENVEDKDEGNFRFTLYILLRAMLGLRSATKPHFAIIYLPIHFLANNYLSIHFLANIYLSIHFFGKYLSKCPSGQSNFINRIC